MRKNKTSRDVIISETLATVLLVSFAFKMCSIAWNLLRRVFLLISNYYNDDRQAIFKLSNFLLSEDTQSILEVLITRETKIDRPPLIQRMIILYLFFNILYGNRIVPYFENKFLPNTKELD
jgi:hypothetical protein